MQAPSSTTLREAADEWLRLAKEGSIRNRSGDLYKPSVLRNYERNLKLRVLPELGGKRVSDVHRGDLQRFVEALVGEGTPPPRFTTHSCPCGRYSAAKLLRGGWP
jgi:integrase